MRKTSNFRLIFINASQSIKVSLTILQPLCRGIWGFLARSILISTKIEGILDLERLTEGRFDDLILLKKLLNDLILFDRSSAKWAMQGSSIALEMLDEVVVALFVELMVLVAGKLDEFVPRAHIHVAKDALFVSIGIQAAHDRFSKPHGRLFHQSPTLRLLIIRQGFLTLAHRLLPHNS